MNQRAIFFDKDGTLIEDVPYNVDPARINLAHGAKACLQVLRSAGFKLFVISNQPGVQLGLFRKDDLDAVRRQIERLADNELDGFYFCPHTPKGVTKGCECRKPEPGLLLRAAAEHQLDARGSWLIGDILDDIEAGNRAGMRTIFLDVGNETEWVSGDMRVPDFTAKSLSETAAIILNNSDVAVEEEAFAYAQG